jgi:two-component system chemotaxis response regulator CheB
MLLDDDLIYITSGAHENRYRPSIDVLFRSAAVSYGNRVIAVILTGMLEDGTSGMSAVKRCGGICIVQDPDEAQFPSMPESILNNIRVDYQATLSAMHGIVNDILLSPLPPIVPIPKEIQMEADITKRMTSNIEQMESLADRSNYVCPDCGGGLWAIKNDPTHRYRCHTGHVFTENLLQLIQNEKIEESIWVCIRMLEEKGNLLKLMLTRQEKNDGILQRGYTRRISDNEAHVKRLKMLLEGLTDERTSALS